MSVQERHRRERRARSEAILKAALHVFSEHGLEHSTIEMIARKAEIAVGTIYLYFSSRDELFLNLTAERTEGLRALYAEIQLRALPPLDELRAIACAYLEYIRQSRELFITQQSVGWSKLRKRIKRASEIRTYKRVMELGHEVFVLWERTVTRVIDAGLIATAMSPAKTATVIWASLNGAFMLMGDDSFFSQITGLSPEHFIEETLESHLALGRTRRDPLAANTANRAPESSSDSVATNGHARDIKRRKANDAAARTSA